MHLARPELRDWPFRRVYAASPCPVVAHADTEQQDERQIGDTPSEENRQPRGEDCLPLPSRKSARDACRSTHVAEDGQSRQRDRRRSLGQRTEKKKSERKRRSIEVRSPK